MGWRDAVFGRKTTPPASPSVATSPPKDAVTDPSAETHFFICSPNESLIEAHNGVLKAGIPQYGGTAEHYTCRGSDLEERQLQAQASDVAFPGESHMGSSAKPLGKMAEVLSSLRAGSDGDTHVAYVKVKDPGAPWVRTVYDRLLGEAMSQGILPYYMYETKDDGAARFLLDSLRRVS